MYYLKRLEVTLKIPSLAFYIIGKLSYLRLIGCCLLPEVLDLHVHHLLLTLQLFDDLFGLRECLVQYLGRA